MDAMLIVSNLHSETKGSWFESGCYMCAEVNMRRLAFCSNRLANVKVLVKRTEVNLKHHESFSTAFSHIYCPFFCQEYQTIKTDFLQQLFQTSLWYYTDQKHIVMCLDMVNSSSTYFPGLH